MRLSLCWEDSVAEDGLSEVCPQIENVIAMKKRVSTMQCLIIREPFVVWKNAVPDWFFSSQTQQILFLVTTYQLIFSMVGNPTALRHWTLMRVRRPLVFHSYSYRLTDGMARLTPAENTIFIQFVLHMRKHLKHIVRFAYIFSRVK